MSSLVNDVTENLASYPMETLKEIKEGLELKGKKIFDFGTGDPKIPMPSFLAQTICENIPKISQYPSIKGTKKLFDAHVSYLSRRFKICKFDSMSILPSRGSKEAIFHIALSLISRGSKKRKIIYPSPGYPVYKSSIDFAGGEPYPVQLKEENKFRLEPWLLPKSIINETKAVWVNYPHNPTGATVDQSYWCKLLDWCHDNSIILLSDECYMDIYDHESSFKPQSPLALSSEFVISFHSLSKRSGLTGVRAGFIAGDKRILDPHIRARANFGLALPDFIQAAAAAAWGDDKHVIARRKIFTERRNHSFKVLNNLGLISEKPQAGFYMWCKLPRAYEGQDEKFCLSLAEKGVITTPSSWLGDQTKGYFRLALVPDMDDTLEAMDIIKEYISEI